MIKITSIKSVVFWLLVLTHLVTIQAGPSWLHFITKPLLMPTLALLLLNPVLGSKSVKLIAAGLFFSWLGDIFLLFDSRVAIFFIAGLASFLITHGCYIVYFLSVHSPAPSLLKVQPLFFVLIAGYGAWLVWLIFPYLGQLKIPVMVYAAVICSMLLCSIHIYKKVNRPANTFYLSGAISFVLSDSILAVNKFHHSFSLAGTWVMLSYCAAQYFIVSGFIEECKLKLTN